MSADVMVICKEDDSSYSGKNPSLALCIDEASMGEAWTEFGGWFQERYCRAPGLFQQLAGIKEHDYILFTEADFEAVKTALSTMSHSGVAAEDFQRFIGKHISTENW